MNRLFRLFKPKVNKKLSFNTTPLSKDIIGPSRMHILVAKMSTESNDTVHTIVRQLPFEFTEPMPITKENIKLHKYDKCFLYFEMHDKMTITMLRSCSDHLFNFTICMICSDVTDSVKSKKAKLSAKLQRDISIVEANDMMSMNNFVTQALESD